MASRGKCSGGRTHCKHNVSEPRKIQRLEKVPGVLSYHNKQQEKRPTPNSEDSNRSTYMQGSIVLGDHTIGPISTDIREHQEMDTILFGFRSHTHTSCREIRKKGKPVPVTAGCIRDLCNCEPMWRAHFPDWPPGALMLWGLI